MTKNWLYKIEGTDTPIATANEPTFGKVSTTGDYYLDGIWYNISGVAYTTPITYLPIVAWIDDQSNIVDIDSYDIPTLNETSIKAEVVNSDLYKGKQVCTAWCNFDGTSTPPTIRDSYNVSDVVRTATGSFDVYFEEPMDNINYSTTSHSERELSINPYLIGGNYTEKTLQKCRIVCIDYSGVETNGYHHNVQIFGGK